VRRVAIAFVALAGLAAGLTLADRSEPAESHAAVAAAPPSLPVPPASTYGGLRDELERLDRRRTRLRRGMPRGAPAPRGAPVPPQVPGRPPDPRGRMCLVAPQRCDPGACMLPLGGRRERTAASGGLRRCPRTRPPRRPRVVPVG
jgi:hypothetical protein